MKTPQKHRAASVLLALAASGVGCAMLVEFDGFSGGGAADASATDGPSGGDDSAMDGAPIDARADAQDAAADTGADGDADPARVTFAPCSGADGGSIMIDAGNFCIDAFEVTQAQYDVFLNSVPANRRQLAECAWNTSFTPAFSFAPATKPNVPVVGVDWCDAYAYCAWVGKRLCGRVGGGTLPFGSKSDPTVAQWYSACANKLEGRAYPYGSSYVPGTCNDDKVTGDAAVATDAGSFPSCEGGLPGLFDMSGNVAEWIDSCVEAPDAAAAVCARRGGDFDNAATAATCTYDSLAVRTQAERDTGFRCCAD